MAMYNDTVIDHFMNPHNVGEIEDASGGGTRTARELMEARSAGI